MTDTLSQLVRAVAFAVLALVGMAMALVFMVSTAIAIGVLYVVAKLRGKPFGVSTYWSERRAPGSSRPFRRPFARTPFGTGARTADVIDVQAREIR